MAAPVVAATATTNGTGASATPVVNIPNGSNGAGQLLLVLIRNAGAGAIGWPAGWTELYESTADASDDTEALAYRYTDGSEGYPATGATITLSSGNAKFAAAAYRITGAEDPAVQAPQAATPATGTSTTPNPPSITPTGGPKDFLYVATMGCEGEQTNPVTYPASFANGITADSGTAGAVTTNVRAALAALETTASSSQDPGTFTISVSDDWTATTVAITPATPATPKSGTDSGAGTDASAETAVYLPDPGSTTTNFEDDMNRTVGAGGLGTASPTPSGSGAYSLSGTAADFSVDGAEAVINLTALGQSKTARQTTALAVADYEYRFAAWFASTPWGTGASVLRHRILVRRRNAGADGYEVRVHIDADGTVKGEVLERTASVLTSLGAAVTLATVTAGSKVFYAIRVEGTTSVRIRMAASSSALPESPTWAMDVTHGTPSADQQLAGDIDLIQGTVQTGFNGFTVDGTTPMVLRWDALKVTSLPSPPRLYETGAAVDTGTKTEGDDPNKFTTDPGVGSDVSAETATYASTEAGTGAEAAAAGAAAVLTDSAAGADAATAGATHVRTDANLTADESVPSFASVRTESGTGADVATEAATNVRTESGVGSDVSSVTVPAATTAENGSGADAATRVASYTGAETGAASDASTAGAALVAAETAAGTDVGTRIDAGQSLSSSDSGSGADASAETASYTNPEPGSGSDTSTETAAQARTESGAGSDAGTVVQGAVNLTAAESGTGSDASIAGAALPGIESAAAAEATTLTVALSPTESATGSDQGIIERLYRQADSAIAAELAALTGAVIATDTGVGTDTSDRHGGAFVAMVRQTLAAALPGVVADVADSRPFEFRPGRLYVWQEDDRQAPAADGRRDFVIRAVLTEPDQGERGRGDRVRDVTLALDAARILMLATIRGAYSTGLWQHATAYPDDDFVRTYGARGIGVRVTGYRIT